MAGPVPIEKDFRVVGNVAVLPSLKSLPRWLVGEVRDELSATAVRENKRQMRRDIDPTRVVVDYRSRDIGKSELRALERASETKRFFAGVDRRITFYYTELGDLADAVEFAWRTVIKLTRRETGKARGTYYLWCSDPDNPSRNGKYDSPAGVRTWLAGTTSRLANVRILGPTTSYRRKLIYNPAGAKQQTRWASPSSALTRGPAIDRYRFTGRAKSLVNPKRTTLSIGIRHRRRGRRTWYQARVAKAIQTMVVQRVKRSYRDVWVGYRFVRSREDLMHDYGVNIPEIYLGIKAVGRAR